MQDRPTVQELLQEVERFLQEEVAPRLEGPRRFHAIVAANAVRIVRRELEIGEGHLREEWEALDALLGPEPPPEGLAERKEALRRRVEEVCRRIRAGEADQDGPFRQGLVRFLWLLTRHKLEVNDPGWLQRQRA
ncbi:hypothetical protein HRbin24_01632 [bacterium HR24]|jgi:hypothetical protein|nr:hypothetical protein HRbin24_01632 [bacterium HR24]